MLSLLSMIGVGMVVPVVISVYAAGYFFPDNTVLLIAFVLFGIAVAFRNTYRMIMYELRRKDDVRPAESGRPEGYRAPDEDEDMFGKE